MCNSTAKPRFVKYKFYGGQNIEITSVIDFRTKQYPNLWARFYFTLNGESHLLSAHVFDNQPTFCFDDKLASLSQDEKVGLAETVLLKERIFRAIHPELHAVIIDRDRLMGDSHE